MFENVDGRTDGRTTDALLYYKPCYTKIKSDIFCFTTELIAYTKKVCLSILNKIVFFVSPGKLLFLSNTVFALSGRHGERRNKPII